MDGDEFDGLSDSFSAVTEAEWSRILGQANATSTSSMDDQSAYPQPIPQTNPTRSTSPTDYGDDSFMDADTLAELDRIEEAALHVSGGPSSITHGTGLPSSSSGDLLPSRGKLSLRVLLKGMLTKRSDQAIRRTTESYFFRINGQTNAQVISHATNRDSENTTSITDCGPNGRPAKRSRLSSGSFEDQRGAGLNEEIRRIFQGYEEELTCPICCDLFVATHVGNPCGHCYCGDCGWQWFKRNRENQCPVCRAKLARSKPLIPNKVMDSLIEKHIEQLSSAGDADWQPQGLKSKERAQRIQKWKTSSEARMKAKQKRKAEIRPIIIEEFPQDRVREVLFLPSADIPSEDDSSYVEDSAEEQVTTESTRIRPRRNVRGRR